MKDIPNAADLDVSLFHKYADRDREGFPHPLLRVDGHPRLATLKHVLRIATYGFDHIWDPFFPRFNPIRTGLVACRIADRGDPSGEEYIFVWRDLAVMFYKHIGRDVAFSRDFKNDDEMEQCFRELHSAFTSHLMRQYYEGESGQSSLTQKAMGQKNSREASEYRRKDNLVLDYLAQKDPDNGESPA